MPVTDCNIDILNFIRTQGLHPFSFTWIVDGVRTAEMVSCRLALSTRTLISAVRSLGGYVYLRPERPSHQFVVRVARTARVPWLGRSCPGYRGACALAAAQVGNPDAGERILPSRFSAGKVQG